MTAVIGTHTDAELLQIYETGKGFRCDFLKV